jgi:hypothetical protein
MTGLAAALPDFRERPVDAEPSAVTLHARRLELDRRTMLRLATGAALGLGLAALDLIGRALPARGVEPSPVLSEWSDCQGFFSSSTVCVPTTAYFGTGVPGVCSGSWHRNYSYTGGSVTYDYTFNNTSCNGRNAWRWTNGTRRKCSDGWTYYRDGTTYRNTFSICRTAI